MLYRNILISVFFLTLACKKDDAPRPYLVDFDETIEIPIGNPDAHYPIPMDAQEMDVSKPNQIVGTGTPESCNCDAFIAAVAKGGVITFNCGDKPHTIKMNRPAKIFNNQLPDIIIDGAGMITLSGEGITRILYMNTCDQNQKWTTSHCQNQDHPRLTVQNVSFINANSKNENEYDGGGAIWVRGGRFKAINCCFFNNKCALSGPDAGGGAIRVFSQFENLPVYIVNCTFGGAANLGNYGSNGGALSSIDVSWSIYNSLFTHNFCTGNGGNPAQNGSPGGGSGGAIYNDGNTMTLKLFGCKIEENTVKAYGAAVFFVSNNHTGNIQIDSSSIQNNTGGSWYPKYEGVSMHDDTPITVTNSVIK